jgi:hypothetical protein
MLHAGVPPDPWLALAVLATLLLFVAMAVALFSSLLE